MADAYKKRGLEVENHIKHLGVTLERLMGLMFSDAELDTILQLRDGAMDVIRDKSVWIRTSDLAVEGLTTEKMAIIHLLWFEHIGRVVVDDVDPLSGAVLVHLAFEDVKLKKEIDEMQRKIS